MGGQDFFYMFETSFSRHHKYLRSQKIGWALPPPMATGPHAASEKMVGSTYFTLHW